MKSLRCQGMWPVMPVRSQRLQTSAAACRMHLAYSSMPTSFRSETFSLTPVMSSCCFCVELSCVSCAFYGSVDILEYLRYLSIMMILRLRPSVDYPTDSIFPEARPEETESLSECTEATVATYPGTCLGQGQLPGRQTLKNARP